jgi:pyruvate ferredoxin oxidoreductase alpha subunit
MKRIGLTGNEAIAYAAKQCDVDVVSAYPITPQTIIVEKYSEYVADGEVDTEFINVESEHSALSACIGASLTGARVFTATASQGLALMHELLYIASSLRCPIVMGVANRALSAPLNIHGDHSDMMGSRDCGWIQIFAENAQEAYDWTIQAFKLSEDPEVLLPSAVNIDGFIISHSMEAVEVLEDEAVRAFLPPRSGACAVDPNKPSTIGPVALPDYYFEFKRQQAELMKRVPAALDRVCRGFAKISGRRYGRIQSYGMEDARTAIICMGSAAGTAKHVAKALRERGERVGVVKVWLYRPFPADDIARELEGLRSVIVMDRAISFGAPFGPLCSDVIGAIYGRMPKLRILNAIYGLGGRDVTARDIEGVYREGLKMAGAKGPMAKVKYVGVRE